MFLVLWVYEPERQKSEPDLKLTTTTSIVLTINGSINDRLC